MEKVNLPHRCIISGADLGAHDFETVTIPNSIGVSSSEKIQCKHCHIHLGQALFELGKLVEEKIK